MEGFRVLQKVMEHSRTNPWNIIEPKRKVEKVVDKDGRLWNLLEQGDGMRWNGMEL